MSKYGARKTICNQGHKHDSKKEANRCGELTLMEKAGVIEDLEQQPTFELQQTFRFNGKTYRKITYTADFKYFDTAIDRVVVEDVKGVRTQVFRLKKKLFLYRHGLDRETGKNIVFKET